MKRSKKELEELIQRYKSEAESWKNSIKYFPKYQGNLDKVLGQIKKLEEELQNE